VQVINASLEGLFPSGEKKKFKSNRQYVTNDGKDPQNNERRIILIDAFMVFMILLHVHREKKSYSPS
jgi:hypothetical protein